MRVPLDTPPGIFSDDTTHAAPGRWADCSGIRWAQGRPESRGGCERLVDTLLTGVCRSIFHWVDNQSVLDIAFGTHSSLEVFSSGTLYDITPTLALPARVFSDPFHVTDGSTTVAIPWAGHGLSTGETIVVSGAVSVGRIPLSGSYAVTKVDDDNLTITAASAADPIKTLGANPLAVTNGSPIVTVTETGHNIADGTSVTFSGATAVGGITPNGTFPITVINANSYKFTFTSNATGTASGGGSAVVATTPSVGGGAAAKLAPQRAYAAGSIDGTGGAGYGTGAYDTGAYSAPSSTEFYPRTWSMAAWGANLIANWRGGPICGWENDTGTRAAPLLNSPQRVTACLVSDTDQVFALGCNEEVSGVFNARCIRHSNVRDNTVWNTASDTTAREYVLPGGGEIITGRLIGSAIAVWTTHALFIGSYVGSLDQPWRFDQIATRCGVIGPNAVVVVGSQAFWLGPDLQFYSYALGGSVQPVDCPIRNDMADNMAPSQGDKVVASSTTSFLEIRFDYPDVRDGVENSRYVTLIISGQDAGAWARGQGAWARTAYVDAGPAPYPVSADASGRALWQERGHSDDGAALSGFLESTDNYLDESRTSLIQGIWPDIAGQVGPVWISIISRFKPQATSVTKGPVSLAPGQGKADIRANGRLHRVRYDFNSAPFKARWGRLVFDVTLTGGR